jgi:hypothetical protein
MQVMCQLRSFFCTFGYSLPALSRYVSKSKCIESAAEHQDSEKMHGLTSAGNKFLPIQLV